MTAFNDQPGLTECSSSPWCTGTSHRVLFPPPDPGILLLWCHRRLFRAHQRMPHHLGFYLSKYDHLGGLLTCSHGAMVYDCISTILPARHLLLSLDLFRCSVVFWAFSFDLFSSFPFQVAVALSMTLLDSDPTKSAWRPNFSSVK